MEVKRFILAINHKPILLEMEENNRKKALAMKWSSTRRKLTNLKDSFPSWKNLGDSHFTQTSKYSFSLSAFKIQFSNPWIIHLRASDYMTNSSKVFSTYIPCMGNQKSKLLMVPLVTMAGQGDVFLTSSLTSRNVLHVPKLSVNLLSTPQITTELTCSINFIQSECSF